MKQGDAADKRPIDATEIRCCRARALEVYLTKSNTRQPNKVEVPGRAGRIPAVYEAPEADESRPYSTQIFTMPTPSGSGATVTDAAPTQDETVDSLMAQISSRGRRVRR